MKENKNEGKDRDGKKNKVKKKSEEKWEREEEALISSLSNPKRKC